MLIVLLLNFGGVGVCLGISMKQLWNGVSAPPEGGKGTGDSAAAALSGGHSFVSVLRERWQLAVVILGLQKSKKQDR